MPTAYIETTIPSYYVARLSASLFQAARQASTRRWWDEGCSGFDLFTSQETLEEISRGDSSMANDRLALLQDVAVLEITDEVAALTKELISSQLVPLKAASDAVHIAVASVHTMDFLVTWNIKHIGNAHIRTRLRATVGAFRATLPVICTPEELLNDENEVD
jgi:hypothetical protein